MGGVRLSTVENFHHWDSLEGKAATAVKRLASRDSLDDPFDGLSSITAEDVAKT